MLLRKLKTMHSTEPTPAALRTAADWYLSAAAQATREHRPRDAEWLAKTARELFDRAAEGSAR